MTLVRATQAAGVVCGLAVLVLAGATLGGWWWLATALGMVGAVSGRAGSLVQAVSTLALAGAAATVDATWLVPLLVLGVVATAETAALPARTNRIRTWVPIAPALAAPLVAAGAAAAVLVLATLAPPFAVPVALAGLLAAVSLLSALRA
jgi:hypothetical protein